MKRTMVVLGLMATACGAPEKPEKPVVVAPVFEAAAPSEGAALFVRGALHGDQVELEVWGKQLGAVLGYAFRVRAENATVESGKAAEALGTDHTIYLAKVSGPSLAIGAAREGAVAGERDLSAETLLATVTLKRGEGVSAYSLADTAVRRANGDGVVVHVTGGGVR